MEVVRSFVASDQCSSLVVDSGIDEISSGKWHQFIIVFINLDRKEHSVLFFTEIYLLAAPFGHLLKVHLKWRKIEFFYEVDEERLYTHWRLCFFDASLFRQGWRGSGST